jgi:hypothetical protein
MNEFANPSSKKIIFSEEGSGLKIKNRPIAAQAG